MLSLSVLISETQAQGSFQNLDFEQADPVSIVGSPYYPYVVTAASALPFWTILISPWHRRQIRRKKKTGLTRDCF